MKKLLFLIPLLVLAACSTTYYDYSGSGILIGQGGASTNINGIDLWIKGTPPRKYRVIGYIEDVRPGGPIPMAARNSQLAAKAKARGGDGLLLNSDDAQMVGTFSTASVNATGWGGPGYFGAHAFGTGATVPIIRRTGTYYVIKYVN
jgi:hypothetical protein